MDRLNAEDFETKVIQSTVPVLVFFHRPLCHGCQQIAPVMDALARGYGQSGAKVRVLECEDQELMRRLRVYFVPQVVLFAGGKDFWIDRGLLTVKGINEAVERILSQGS